MNRPHEQWRDMLMPHGAERNPCAYLYSLPCISSTPATCASRCRPRPREVEATIGARIRCDRYLVDAMTIVTIVTRSSIAHPSVSTALGHALLPGPRRHLFRARGCAGSRDVVDRNRCELEIDPRSVVWGLRTWYEHAGRSC